LGNTHPLARPEFDRGPVAAERRLERMILVIKPEEATQRELDALTDAQQRPASAHFRDWLTAEQFGDRFGASRTDLERASAWLRSHGFDVEEFDAGHRSIVFSGTAGAVEETFHTQIHRYVVEGREHIANSQDPQIPRGLAGVVSGILSLHDFRRNSMAYRGAEIADPDLLRRVAVNPENTEGSSHFLFPADFATIYDLNPLYSAGKSGAGVSIAIVGRSNINLSDVASFRSYAGLAANAPTVIFDGSNPGLIPGDQDEATLDVEWSGGIAPKAQLKFVVAGSTATTDGVDLSAQYIVNHKIAWVMSTSFGECEANMGAAEIAFYNSLWQQAAAEGISAFVSSGDSGASGCDAGSAKTGTGAAVNGMCTSPYVTCVGGTEFNEGKSSATYWGTSNGSGGASALSYIPEKVWNESVSQGGQGLWASGGGISQVFTQPSWQEGVPGANSDGMRAVPDVALNAASHDGYLVCLNGSWYDFSGTSAASPSFAAIMALLVQEQGGKGQGNANPGLYALLGAANDAFHPTSAGNNSVPGVGGFLASGAAYNLATGLGSVDANVLAQSWVFAGSGVQAGFSLKPAVGSLSVVAGKSVSFKISIAPAGGFAGKVSLTASKMPSGIEVSFNPSVLAAGGVSTVTVTSVAGSSAWAGSILLTGTSEGISSAGLQADAAINVTVQQAASLAVTSSAQKIVLAQGGNASVSVTALTSGVFSGSGSWTVEGLPKGVSASWSTSSFKAVGSGSFTSTLTFKATSAAKLANTTVEIVAAGDGLTTQVSIVLEVKAASTAAVE
jgi:subtilase family serine protease